VGDGFSIRLVEIDPYFYAVADGLGSFGRDESKAIDLFTPLEILANDFESEMLVDFLFIGLDFRHLEDEPSSFLILLIFPFGLNPFPEELD
jgi:hypothetical protein